jgi:hypothetical protein
VAGFTQQDPYQVQQAGGDHEGQAEQQGVAAGRQFDAMGMAVEHREGGHDQSRHPERRPEFEQHHQAHHQTRDRDADLHAGDGNAQQAEQPPEGHHHREGHRQHPERWRPEYGPPEPHGHHRHHVIEARDWVQEPRHEAAAMAGVGMGPGRRRRQGHCGKGKGRQEARK